MTTLDDHLQYLNSKPGNDYIEMFASDWLKEHWSFYAYIDATRHEHDLELINSEIARLNYRDGDVYVELIDRSPGLEHFYDYLCSRGECAHWDVLDNGYWNALEERGDDHFLILRRCFGAQYHRSPEDARDEDGYAVYSGWNDVLENLMPEVYKVLEEHNATSCFDTEAHFYGTSYTNLSDGRVVLTG